MLKRLSNWKRTVVLVKKLCVAVHFLFSSTKLVIKFCFFSSLYFESEEWMNEWMNLQPKFKNELFHIYFTSVCILLQSGFTRPRWREKDLLSYNILLASWYIRHGGVRSMQSMYEGETYPNSESRNCGLMRQKLRIEVTEKARIC